MSPHEDDFSRTVSRDDESPRTTRRQLVGFALAAATALGTSATVVAAARHDDHDKDDDSDSDHDDSDHDKDDDDDDQAGAVARELPDGSFEVRITDDDADAFLPGSVTVQAGGAITWTNNDDKPHTATGAGWDTGTIEPGTSATVVFEQGGSFAYACLFHPIMTGTVIVHGVGATPVASPAATPTATGNEVRIFNLAYEPATLEIAVGTSVTWTNDDSLPHTATSADGAFDTNTIPAGTTAELTFDTAGSFEYVCAFHPGMNGTIVVS